MYLHGGRAIVDLVYAIVRRASAEEGGEDFKAHGKEVGPRGRGNRVGVNVVTLVGSCAARVEDHLHYHSWKKPQETKYVSL